MLQYEESNGLSSNAESCINRNHFVHQETVRLQCRAAFIFFEMVFLPMVAKPALFVLWVSEEGNYTHSFR